MVEVEKRGFDTAAFLASADQGTRIDQLARSMFELFAIVKKSSTLPSYQISGELGISEARSRVAFSINVAIL
jgi:hypothetical protein